MIKTFSIAAAALAVVIAGAASASACQYTTYTTYTPVKTYVVQTHVPVYYSHGYIGY